MYGKTISLFQRKSNWLKQRIGCFSESGRHDKHRQARFFSEISVLAGLGKRNFAVSGFGFSHA